MKILIIDDEAMTRETTALLLKKENFTALTARNGKEGMEISLKERPDLILLDIMMPDMDGWEVLKSIKDNRELTCIPVVIFTAVGYEFSDTEAKVRGASGIIRKPFHLDSLINTIHGIAEGV